MSDLTQSQWREIDKASIYLPQDGSRAMGRYIGVGTLRSILRKSRRTNNQNALLWALYEDALRIGGETLGGWSRDDLHEFALGSYFGWEQHDALGMKRLKPKRRSSRLTKVEFADFVDNFVRQMAEHGIVLHLPGELNES